MMGKITLMLTEDELISSMAETSIQVHRVALEDGHDEDWIVQRLKGMYYFLAALWRWAELPGDCPSGGTIGMKIRSRQEELMADQQYLRSLGW